MQSINSALIFLSNTLFSFYILVVMIRLLMFRFAAYYVHPACQFVYKSTDKALKPFNRFLPIVLGFETGTLLFIYVLIFAQLLIMTVLSGRMPALGGLFIWALALFISKLFNLYFFLIIAFVVVSWLIPFIDSTISQIIARIVSPLLYPFQRYIPLVGGIDISPLAAIILIQAIKIALVYPLVSFGAGMAVG